MQSWNKGNGDIMNQIHIIQNILQEQKPHVVLITEFNMRTADCEKMYKPQGYNIELDSTRHQTGYTRTAAYVKTNIVYTSRTDLEPDNNPIIWLQLGLLNKKKILLQSIYRQWMEPGKLETKSIKYQNYTEMENSIE